MDADRFDRISRTFAHRSTRRVVGKGAATGLLAAIGLQTAAVAQEGNAGTCELDLVATVRLGPSIQADLGGDQPGELHGLLQFGLSGSGELVDGRITLPNGSELEAGGQVTGQAVTLRIEAPLAGVLVLVGAGEQSFSSCEGSLDGVMTGPQAGDLGDWHATVSGSDSVAAQTTLDGSQSSAQQPQAPGNPTEASAATCGDPGAPCDGDGDCCIQICLDGICVACSPVGGICSGAGQAPRPCCAGLVCGAGACYVSLGGACTGTGECINGDCIGGMCSEPPPCAATSESCASIDCCVGYCTQDATCECVPPNQACAGIGTGGCCSGQPCANGLCP